MIRTQVQLTEAQVKRLKKLAQEKNESIAALVRQGVDLVLAAKTHEDEMLEKRRRAILVSGRFNSGLPDLGVNHDYYLAEAISNDPKDLKVIEE